LVHRVDAGPRVGHTRGVSEQRQAAPAPAPVVAPVQAAPAPLPPGAAAFGALGRLDAVVALSRTSGNQAVGRALEGGGRLPFVLGAGADPPAPPAAPSAAPAVPLQIPRRRRPRRPAPVSVPAPRGGDRDEVAGGAALLRAARDDRDGPRRPTAPVPAAQAAIRGAAGRRG
jgi:hypothetical protein